jgi:hypothetical protein
MIPENIVANRRREGELLLSCARTHLDAATAQRIDQLLGGEIDWNYLIRKASWHGLLPLLYWNLREKHSQAVPSELWRRVEAHFHLNTKRCLLLTGELFKILDLFGDHGIKACPFKGPTLSAALYQNIGLRTFGDLDILVPRHDIRRAVDLLTSLGYAGGPTQEQPVALDTEPADADPETIGFLQPHHYTLTRDLTGIGLGNLRIDLQWRISENHFAFSLDSEERWAQLKPVAILNRHVPSFTLDDLFLILCVHGCKHYWYRIKWICDIAEILRANEAHDWSACMATARTLGVERMVKLSIFLAADLLQAPVPAVLMQEIEKDSHVISNARWISKRLFAESEGRIDERFAFFFYLTMKDHWWDGARHCLIYIWQFLTVIITPTRKERSTIRLPGLLHFLYYFIRPIRLSALYSRTALRRAYSCLRAS